MSDVVQRLPESPQGLRRKIVACAVCPRLLRFREGVKPRASFASQSYWRKPVPGFGDLEGRLLVLGLAPATHGGNRTGRIFTGDPSSRFLVTALYTTGFANQPRSESRKDGLVYRDCYVTAAVKCAPPGDKPTPQEFANCSAYLDLEIRFMKNLRAVLTLGALSFKAYLDHLRRSGMDVGGAKFAHGKKYAFEDSPPVYLSYHPSPRNTNTGVLTQPMLVDVLERIKREMAELDAPQPSSTPGSI